MSVEARLRALYNAAAYRDGVHGDAYEGTLFFQKFRSHHETEDDGSLSGGRWVTGGRRRRRRGSLRGGSKKKKKKSSKTKKKRSCRSRVSGSKRRRAALCNPWVRHVKAYMRKHRCSYTQALKRARASYSKKSHKRISHKRMSKSRKRKRYCLYINRATRRCGKYSRKRMGAGLYYM